MCSHTSCSHHLLEGGSDEVTVEAVNAARTQIGDVVKVSYDPGRVLVAAFLVYLLPIIGGLALYFLGEALWPFLLPPVARFNSIAAAVVAVILFIWSLRRGERLDVQYTVTGKVDPSQLLIFDEENVCRGCPFRSRTTPGY